MIIQTSGGQVRGYFDHSLYTFKGIPYGRAKRFCPAVPAHWDGVLDCASYGKKAMQPLPAPDGGPASDPDDYSEDCLYLNVYIRLTGAPPPSLATPRMSVTLFRDL